MTQTCGHWKFRATLTGCEGRIVCWEPFLLVERPAQAADPQPGTNPSQLWFAVKRACYAELRGEVESKRAPP